MVSVDKCSGDNCPCKSLKRKRINITGLVVFSDVFPGVFAPPAPGMAMAIRAAMVREKHAARTEAMR